MKNAIILHGTSGTPESFWIPYIRKHLEEQDYNVWIPQLPETDNPQLNVQLPFVLENGTFNVETLLISHSAGCPLALAILQNLEVKIKKAILVAGFAKQLKGLEQSKQMLMDFDWKRIKQHVQEIFFINSDNDPWHCDDEQGRYMFDKLGGTLIIRHGEGHMGSGDFNQPYKEFPLLKKLI